MYVYADIGYLSRLWAKNWPPAACSWPPTTIRAHRAALLHELKQMPALQSVTARADMIATLEDTVVKNQSVIIDLFVFFAGHRVFRQHPERLAGEPCRAAARGGHAPRAWATAPGRSAACCSARA